MELQSLLDDLYNEPNIDKRRYVPDKLAKLGDWRATHPLGKLIINNEQPQIMRNEAVESLGKQGDPQAVSYLVQVLDDEVDDIRRTAVWSLGQIGVPETLDPIFSMVKDENVEVRRWVAKSAGRVRTDEVMIKLREYINSIDFDDERVLADIIRAVTTQIDRLPKRDEEFWVGKSYQILQSEVKNYVKQAVMILLNELFSRGNKPKTELLLNLNATLPENDPLVRPQIMLAMGYAGKLEFLEKQDHQFAIHALGIAGDKTSLDDILEQNTSEEYIIAALEAYRYLKTVPNLEKWIKHQNITIKTQALQLHAIHQLPIDVIHQAYENKLGRYKILEIYRYYGDEAIPVFENSAIHSDKVARQNTVYSLISKEMISMATQTDKIKEILKKVSKTERIWHIRRDARIGLEKFEEID